MIKKWYINRVRAVNLSRGVALICALLVFLSANPANAYYADNANKIDPLQASKALRGNFQVGEFSGAGIYNYSFDLPEGRSGLTPNLSLTYNSQNNAFDYIAGLRWDMTQYSIYRVNKTGVEDLYSRNDYAIDAPFDSGEMDLINSADQIYKPESDAGFARIQKQGQKWIATTKDGAKYIFGATTDARQSDPANPSRIYKWMLETVEDTNGNTIHYSYLKADNQLYPKTITYGPFEVRFLPFADNQTGSQRSDWHFSYASGFRIDTKYLVTGIEIVSDENLRKKYNISHTTVNPLTRKTIASITEIAYDLNGAPTQKPSTQFNYSTSEVRWEETTDYTLPFLLNKCYYECTQGKNVLQWDMNQDGIDDFETFNNNSIGVRYVSDGHGNWLTEDAEFLGASPTYDNRIPSLRRKPVDWNGDGRTDVVHSNYFNSSVSSYINIKNGTPFLQNKIPIAFGTSDSAHPDHGSSIADLNGDGLPDIMRSRSHANGNDANFVTKETCLNGNGENCVLTGQWQNPEVTIADNVWEQESRRAYVQDCNYDGLADVYFGGSGPRKWINDGQGGFIRDDNNSQCRFFSFEGLTHRQADLNGDGLIDVVDAHREVHYVGHTDTRKITINTGNGNSTYSNVFPVVLGFIPNNGGDGGVRLVDLNGDKLPDIVKSYAVGDTNKGTYETTKKVWMNTGSRPYFLETIHESSGATIQMEYKTSAQYYHEDGSRANQIPFLVDTVSKVTRNPAIGPATVTEYFYEDGHYYYKNPKNREFAGFRVVTKTDADDRKTKTYYHQSENGVDDAANGEFQDSIVKKGRPYREEVYHQNGDLLQITINKWGQKGKAPVIESSVTIDQSGTPKATAKTFTYDAYGNKTRVIDFGEVSANMNGTFTDIGNDKITIDRSYALNTDDYLVGYVAEQKMIDQSGQTLSHQKQYYDDLPLGQIQKGNQTKGEKWLDTENRFITTTTTYNSFGLPVSETDARGNTTTYTYGQHNLYPATTVNALGHTTQTTYDIVTGNLISKTDANGVITQKTYDGLGRLIKTAVSDPDNPTTVITRINKTYNDNSMPRSIQTTRHDGNGKAVDQFIYQDGFGRTIEEKREAANGKWITSGQIFDNRGNVKKSIQPFFASSSGYETLSESRIGTTYTYDSLDRVLSEATPVGTTAISYDGWVKTVTDPNGEQKTYHFDARNNLIRVDEHVDNALQTTLYRYDSVGNLVGITDASGNLREFAYDSLGRRTSQTAAHKPNASFGFWRYGYDDSGNMTRQTDPKNQTIHWTYDALDRVLTEDNQDQSGTELTYSYDQGQYAKGRLSSVSSATYEHNLTYDALGRVLTDQKRIDDKTFLTRFAHDLLGGIETMTYPDGTQVNYTYNSAHQIASLTASGQTMATNFRYSPAGQVESYQLGNGVVINNTFDASKMYRMTQKSALLADATLQNYRYTYDAVGNLTQLTDQNNSETAKVVNYEYDPLYRLTAAHYTQTANENDITQTYEYDAIGNITHKSDIGSFSYDHVNPHAVTAAGDKTFDYDENGNLTDHNGTVQTYDYRNRLIQSGDLLTYQYGEGYDRVLKEDLQNGNRTYYPDKYYELHPGKEIKYLYAGDKRVAKLERLLIPAPEVSQATGVVERPFYTFTITKEPDLSLEVNGQELLPLGPETSYTYEATLSPGANTFDFYTIRKDGERSKSITRTVNYSLPTPTVEPVESPVYDITQTLTGTKRANTSLWINGEEVLPLGEETTWQTQVELTQADNTFRITAKDEVGNESAEALLNLEYVTQPPEIDVFDYATQTPFTITGTKRPELELWINDAKAVDDGEINWQADLDLEKGVNQFTVVTKNQYGIASEATQLAIPFGVNAPTLDQVPQTTTQKTLTISGLKPAYTSLYLNDKEVIEMSPDDIWVHELTLSSGKNEFVIYTKDEDGQRSFAIPFSITYNPPAAPVTTTTTPTSTTAPTSTSSGGGGGGYEGGQAVYTSPDQLKADTKRSDENDAQDANPRTKNQSQKDEKDPVVKQSPKIPKIPKPLRPEAESITGVEFRNLEIHYYHNRAIMSWSPMSREVKKFEVYRSKRGFPHHLSKDPRYKIADVEPDNFKNRFIDHPPVEGERYSYRIVALNAQGQILTTSIKLDTKKLFIDADETTSVEFTHTTNIDFDKVYLSSNDYLKVERSWDGHILRLTPVDGFTQGTQVQARYLTCITTDDGKDYCKEADRETLEVYVMSQNSKRSRFSSAIRRFASSLIPTAFAQSSTNDGQHVYYLLNDHLGSTDVVLDSEGNVVERYDYLPYGTERVALGESDEKHRFTGQKLDEETGLYYYSARYYDPTIGRFISSDTWEGDLEDPQSLNTYAYTRNNPVIYNDPTGNFFETAWDILNTSYDVGVIVKNATEIAIDSVKSVAANNETAKQAALASLEKNKQELKVASTDLAFDAAMTFVPFAPAGVTKGIRAAKKVDKVTESSTKVRNSKKFWTATQKKSSTKNAFDHWKKHRDEFPELQNAKGYVEKADDFLNNPSSKSLMKKSPNGDIKVYEPSTNIFGVKDKSGTPRTLFKPKEGINYFNKSK